MYGGLVESITSLGIVTSAATAGTPTGKILKIPKLFNNIIIDQLIFYVRVICLI